MTKSLALVSALVVSLMALAPMPHAAADSDCIAVGWEQASADCQWTYPEYVESSSSGDGHTWYVTIQPNNGGIQNDELVCGSAPETGLMYDVYMDGIDVGDVCVPDEEVREVDIVQLVISEFKRMDWPASDLVVQPPGGKTLVNFETNFFTLNNQAILKSVTVAGQRVEIRAIPTSYTFHFGDDTRTTTANPGRPHPNLDVTHVYDETGMVSVRLDTTYGGEYRIGGGDWAPIAESLTVAGAEQGLEIVEAVPQLVLQ